MLRVIIICIIGVPKLSKTRLGTCVPVVEETQDL
jgi:hypothetical protein